MLFWQQMHLLATTGLITLLACTLALCHTWPSSIHHALASHIILTAVFAFLIFNFPQTSLIWQLILLFALPFRMSLKIKHKTLVPQALAQTRVSLRSITPYSTFPFGVSAWSPLWEFLSYSPRFLSLFTMPLRVFILLTKVSLTTHNAPSFAHGRQNVLSYWLSLTLKG
jgi:hypothetical protein